MAAESKAPRPSSGRRLAGIEGLRALAASSVLIYHAWLYSDPDGSPVGLDTAAAIPFQSLALGVTLFFVLSGFLLYRPFVRAALSRERLPSVGAYFRNRALRILPAYWVILALAGLVLQTTLLRNGATLEAGALTDPRDFLSTALLVHNYAPGTVVTGIGPAWSLAVEVVFYLFVPLLGALALVLSLRARGARSLLAAALAPAALMLLIGLSGKLVAATLVTGSGPDGGWAADWHSVLVRSFWAQADLFAFGMVVAVLHVQAERGALRLPDGWRTIALAAAVPLGLLAAVRLDLVDGQFSYLPENTVVAAAFAALLALVIFPVRGGPSRLTRRLEAPMIVWVGLISYSVFLWHEPVVRWLEAHGLVAGGAIGLAINIAVLAIVSGGLATLTYRFVERPALRHKASMRRAPKAPRAGQAARAEAATLHSKEARSTTG
jgi:peptidoglycan/LPS O-acetylase OafA/YrhL